MTRTLTTTLTITTNSDAAASEIEKALGNVLDIGLADARDTVDELVDPELDNPLAFIAAGFDITFQSLTEQSGDLPFTVLLQRPDWIADNYGLDTFLAHVYAKTPMLAVPAAWQAAKEADELDDDADLTDYTPLRVIAGHHFDINPEPEQ